jgi:hypothetical protein
MAQNKKAPASTPQFPNVAKQIITYNIISSPEKTFGYDILVDGKLMIHQPSKPGMPGIRAFDTKQDAEKVAKLVIQKMKNGEMPPTVSSEEMKKLKVIKP